MKEYTLLLKAINNDTFEIHGKDEKLDFTFVDDLAEGTIKAALSKNVRMKLNITTGSGRTILSYAKILKKYFKKIKFKKFQEIKLDRKEELSQ